MEKLTCGITEEDYVFFVIKKNVISINEVRDFFCYLPIVFS